MNRTIINYLVKRAAHCIVNKTKLANTKTNSVGTEKRTELQVNLEKKNNIKNYLLSVHLYISNHSIKPL